MDSTTLSYQYIAQLFVVVLNGVMLLPLVLNWLGKHKPYLMVFVAAGVLEICRQIPNAYLAIYVDDLALVMVSLLLQYTATAVFLVGLYCIGGPLRKRQYIGVLLPSAGFLLVMASIGIQGLPDNRALWLIYSIPMSLLSLLLMWQAWQLRQGLSAGKILLVATALALLGLRLAVPFMEVSDLFYLLYYLENMLFPLLLAAVTVLELEDANRRISDMHARRKQSEQELQFIVDNALDVILVTDQVGLLQSWNKPAEAIFGYTAEQIVGKMHIDELFCDANLNSKLDDYAEFSSRIEHLEGGVHEVDVRMRTVVGSRESHMVFVIRSRKSSSDNAAEPLEFKSIKV
ncbi:MAG: PAS domain S-box protein [Pseudomonadales bacterium]|nr:PAS domain S-box protein [Pseudomonadales bacterium]